MTGVQTCALPIYSTFDGGGSGYDGKHDFFFIANLTLEYQFSKHLSGHIGYNYDTLSSEIDGRDFDRNRVYLGLSATY